MSHPSHRKLEPELPHFARNYKTKAPPIRAPAITMMVERSDGCSAVVASLDLVDEPLAEAEDAAEFVPEA